MFGVDAGIISQPASQEASRPAGTEIQNRDPGLLLSISYLGACSSPPQVATARHRPLNLQLSGSQKAAKGWHRIGFKPSVHQFLEGSAAEA